MDILRKLTRSELGATAIEYALIASLIAIAAIAAMQSVGTNVNATYSNVANAL